MQGASAADFRGKTITVTVGFEAGGPYDLYTRLVARYFGAHLPGAPTVIVQNMPGAGGMLAVNSLYNVAPRDGTSLAVGSQTVAIGQLLQIAPGIKYDVREVVWIGRMNANVEVEYGWHEAKLRRIEDAKLREVPVAGTGPTSSSVVFPRLLNALIGTRFKVVTGYSGPTSAHLALERGEVEAVGKTWSAMKVETPDLLRDRKILLIVQYTTARHAELPDIPAIVEYGRDQEQRQMLALFASGGSLGMSIMAPPGLEPDLAEALRAGFDATMRDPGLLAEVARTKLDIAPLPGAAVQKLAGSIFAIVPEVVARAKALSQQP